MIQAHLQNLNFPAQDGSNPLAADFGPAITPRLMQVSPLDRLLDLGHRTQDPSNDEIISAFQEINKSGVQRDSRLSDHDENRIGRLLYIVSQSIAKIDSKSLLDMTDACERLLIRNPSFARASLSQLIKRSDLDSSERVKLCDSLFKLNLLPVQSFKYLMLGFKPEVLSPEELYKIVLIHGKLNLCNRERFDGFASAVKTHAEEFTPMQTSEIIRGFSIASPAKPFNDMWAVLGPRIPEMHLGPAQVIAVYHALLFKRKEAEFDDAFLARLDSAIQTKKDRPVEQNGFERHVGQSLRRLKILHAPQSMIIGFRVDFEANHNKKLWAIECDGRDYHRVAWHDSAPLFGDDIMKQSLIQREGYKVLRIDSEHWKGLANRQSEWLENQFRLQSN